jgi:hypothetical protein
VPNLLDGRFGPPEPPRAGVGPVQWTGQPGVGSLYHTNAIPRQLIVWDDLPVVPPAPWYITERPVFVPGKGYVTTAQDPTSANPVGSVAP